MAKKNDKITKTDVPPILTEIAKDFNGLRDALYDEINLIRANKVPVARGRVVANLAKRVIETATLELFAQKILGDGKPQTLKRMKDGE